MRLTLFALLICAIYPARASDADAIAISSTIRARHMPFGTILDPIYASSTGNQIIGYTRCGDSALWTGAYLAAEAFRHKVTQSAEALDNVKAAAATLKALIDITGDNRLARCMVAQDSPYAAGIQSEEASNTIHANPPWFWVDNTSRDQVVGAYFGLGVAFELVDDAGVKSTISDVATRLAGFISRHQWSPNDDVSNTFLLRAEELQMLLQVTRHVNPSDTISGPLLVPPVRSGPEVDVLGLGSYFKFNLDYMTFYNLVRIQDNGENRAAYQTVRDFTASHQNAFFNMVDRALRGPDSARDAETRVLLDQWLQRSRRDFKVDLTKTVPVCGAEACQPVPVPMRPPSDFLWQRDPFQLAGGGDGRIESAGIDYILPYWMARFYGVIAAPAAVTEAAASTSAVAPNSIASVFGSNLAAGEARAQSQPLPLQLGGISLTVTDSAGAQRDAPLIFVSPGQINFVVPDGTAIGAATFIAHSPGGPQNFAASVQAVAPALFSMNGNGTGVAAATAIRTLAGNPGLQSPVTVFQCDASGCVAVPIDPGLDTPVYLTFYGTGFRNRDALGNVKLTIDGVGVPVQYAGPAPGFTGLDQVNAPLSLALRGRGESNVVLTVNGMQSNVVTISVQ
jgi:uncharacterized protein (TIGR03437 family)